MPSLAMYACTCVHVHVHVSRVENFFHICIKISQPAILQIFQKSFDNFSRHLTCTNRETDRETDGQTSRDENRTSSIGGGNQALGELPQHSKMVPVHVQ